MKSYIALPIAGTFVLGLSACATYQATIDSAPALNVYANYEEKIPGNYALHVDAEKLKGMFKFSGFGCSAHDYPADARVAFETSALHTFENLVEYVEKVSDPLSRPDLEARGYDGMILLEAEDLDVDITLIPGFWTADAEADAEVVVNMIVEGQDKRLIGTSAEGDEESTAELGGFCDGAQVAVGEAIEGAIKEVLKRLGERLANSPGVRN